MTNGEQGFSEAKSSFIRILLVDDDPGMQEIVTDYFRNHDIEIAVAASGQEAWRHLNDTAFSLVILDLRLGQEDGLDFLRELRVQSDLPVIITTGHRRDEVDRVVGLELGADDYVTKPFSLRELLARVRVVLRRVEQTRTELQRSPSSGRNRFAGWVLDRRQRSLTSPTNEAVLLTKGEYGLLLAFVDAPQRPLSREFLLNATRLHEDIFDRSIDVQILRLRRKLEADPSAPTMIRTERGVGYIFTPPVETLL